MQLKHSAHQTKPSSQHRSVRNIAWRLDLGRMHRARIDVIAQRIYADVSLLVAGDPVPLQNAALASHAVRQLIDHAIDVAGRGGGLRVGQEPPVVGETVGTHETVTGQAILKGAS